MRSAGQAPSSWPELPMTPGWEADDMPLTWQYAHPQSVKVRLPSDTPDLGGQVNQHVRPSVRVQPSRSIVLCQVILRRPRNEDIARTQPVFDQNELSVRATELDRRANRDPSLIGQFVDRYFVILAYPVRLLHVQDVFERLGVDFRFDKTARFEGPGRLVDGDVRRNEPVRDCRKQSLDAP